VTQTRTQHGLVRNTATITATNLLTLKNTMKRKYYPNNWEAIKACPPQYFPPMEYEEFADWKIHGYVLPSSVFGVIRTECPKTGKVEEYTYQTKHHAKQRLNKEIKKNKKIVLATMEGVYHLQPNPPLDFI